MCHQLFYPFSDQEKTGFATQCEQAGFCMDDFVLQVEQHLPEQGLWIVKRQIVVARDAHCKRYMSQTWLHQFSADLRNGAFGSPSPRMNLTYATDNWPATMLQEKDHDLS